LSDIACIDSSVIGTLFAAQVAGLLLTVRGATGSVRRTLEVAAVGEVIKVKS
jgi:anti-anti-sigma regulatory factor